MLNYITCVMICELFPIRTPKNNHTHKTTLKLGVGKPIPLTLLCLQCLNGGGGAPEACMGSHGQQQGVGLLQRHGFTWAAAGCGSPTEAWVHMGSRCLWRGPTPCWVHMGSMQQDAGPLHRHGFTWAAAGCGSPPEAWVQTNSILTSFILFSEQMARFCLFVQKNCSNHASFLQFIQKITQNVAICSINNN